MEHSAPISRKLTIRRSAFALKLQIERRRGGKVPNSRSVINIGLQNPTPTEDGGIHKFFLDLAFIGGSNVPLFFEDIHTKTDLI